MTPETAFKNKVKQFLNERNILHIPYAASKFGRAGIPDTLICINGLFIAVEFKAENGKVDELQRKQISRINHEDGIAFVLYPKDFEKFKALILSLMFWSNDDTILFNQIKSELREMGA